MTDKTLPTPDDIAARLAVAIGGNLQDAILGTITLNSDGSNPATEAYTVPVQLAGMPEVVYARYNPLLDTTALYQGSPVEMKVNSDGEYEILGLASSAGREAYATTPPVRDLTAFVHDHQTDTGGGQLNASAVFNAGVVPLVHGGLGANLASSPNGTLTKNGTSVTTRLDKLNATTAPTVNDDSGDGYSVGSQWIDTTNDKAYVCVDASAGAAVWVEQGGSSISLPLFIPDGGIGDQITAGTSGTIYASSSASLFARKDMEQSAPVIPTVNDDSGDGYAKASYWLNHSASNAFFVCTDETPGAAVWLEAGVPLSNPQNWVYAAPTSGSGRMSVRALVANDIPAITVSKISNASGALISSQTLASSATSISFTSIPATYTHLELILFLRSDNAGTGELAIIRINADTTAANYFSMRGVISHSASITTAETLGATTGGIVANAALGNGATAGHYGVFRVLIPRYSAAVKHTLTYDGFRLQNTTTGTLQKTFGGGIHTTAAAITQIDVLPNTGTNWLTGSSASLIGLF